VESYCSTYNPDVFVVVYSVVDRKSLKAAEDILLFLWKSDYVATRGVILVGNKADLERKREVPLSGINRHYLTKFNSIFYKKKYVILLKCDKDGIIFMSFLQRRNTYQHPIFIICNAVNTI
jgi:Ras family.